MRIKVNTDILVPFHYLDTDFGREVEIPDERYAQIVENRENFYNDQEYLSILDNEARRAELVKASKEKGKIRPWTTK